MVDYIKGVIIMGTVSSLIVMALPAESERVGKYVKYLSVLMLLVVMLSPLAGLSGFIASVAEALGGEETDITPLEDTSAEAVIEKAAENISEYIKSICHDKFDQPRERLTVKLILDETDVEGVTIEEIQIFTSELDGGRRRKMAAYFEELLQTRVFVFGT